MKKATFVLSIALALIMLSTSTFAVNTSLPGNSVSIQLSAPVKKALPALAKPNLKKTLSIAEKYYKLAQSKATTHEKLYMPIAISWKPDFTGNSQSPAKASQYLNSSAYLTAYTDLKGIYLPLNSAVFVLDTGNATAAGNLASAIAAYSEDTTKKPLGTALLTIRDAKPYAEDAAAVYEYALSLKLSKPSIDIGAMPLLLNYGYINIDLNRLDAAKVIFETANKLSPGYMPAVEGMAAYWLAKGDKAKARMLLENANLSIMHKTLKKMAEDSSEKKVPNVQFNDSVAVMETKLKNLAKIQPVLATDFYENLDPAGTAKARQLVSELQKSIKYSAPDYNYLSQYSTLKNFYSDGGQAAYEAFSNELLAMEERLASKQMDEAEMEGLASEMDQLVDGTDIDPVIIAEKFAKTSAASKMTPEMLIFMVKSSNYVNPTDIAAQKYNVAQLLRKSMGYQTYLAKQIDEIQKVVMPTSDDLSRKLKPLEEARNEELDQLSREHNQSHKTSGDCNTCIVKKHSIHSKYDSNLNNLVETSWMDVTNFVSARYTQRIKPNIDAMYVNCMQSILLISDPDTRAKTEKNFTQMIENFILTSLNLADEAYKIDTHGYPYECDCSEAEVAAASAREHEAQLTREAEMTAMQNKARKAFEAGEIPENSQLYQRLDKYTANLQLLFMTCKMHPLKTEVAFEFKLPGTLKNEALSTDAGVTLKMTENHIRNTTSYSGTISANLKGSVKDGAFGAAASVAVKGEMTVDGKGNVINADIAGTAQGTVTAGMIEASGGYEASVQRGCKFTGEVNKIYTDMLQTPEAVEIFQPPKPKTTLWKGEYQVSE